MSSLIETEVKIAVADLDAIRERLEAAGAGPRGPRGFWRDGPPQGETRALAPPRRVFLSATSATRTKPGR